MIDLMLCVKTTLLTLQRAAHGVLARFLFYLHSSAHFIIKYSFFGENTVLGVTEYSF